MRQLVNGKITNKFNDLDIKTVQHGQEYGKLDKTPNGNELNNVKQTVQHRQHETNVFTTTITNNIIDNNNNYYYYNTDNNNNHDQHHKRRREKYKEELWEQEQAQEEEQKQWRRL